MRIGLLTFEKYHRKKFDTIGSSRIRMNTMANYWPDAEVFKWGRKYDVVVYQKVYDVNHAKNFKGIKILDICDADFLHWGYKTVEMMEHCDALVCSTEALAKRMASFVNKPIWVIPDRMDMNNYPEPIKHIGQATKIGWYGYAHNFRVLNESGIIKALVDFNKRAKVDKNILPLEFYVISEGIYAAPAFAKDIVRVVNYKWTLKTVDGDIRRCDIIINPKLNVANFQFKSNNKTLHSLALGVPVAHNLNELQALLDPDIRNIEIEKKQKILKDKYHIEDSIKEFKELINVLYKQKMDKR